MRDSVKNYLALASGLTELTRERAMHAAEALVAQGEAAKDQVTALAEELLVSSKSNREAIAALVRTEVDRTVARLGVAKNDDVSAMFRGFETSLREAASKAADAVHEMAVGMGLADQPAAPSTPSSSASSTVATVVAVPAGAAAKSAARKTAAKPSAAKTSAAKPAKAAPAKAAPAKAAPAKSTKAVAPAKAAKPATAVKSGTATKAAKAAAPAKAARKPAAKRSS